jgi:hypothetical protein
MARHGRARALMQLAGLAAGLTTASAVGDG